MHRNELISKLIHAVENYTDKELKEIISSLQCDEGNLSKQIIHYLNEQLGKEQTRGFKPSTPRTRKLIKARVKEGHDLIHFKTVIKDRVKKWKGDPLMEQYLRPETLFGNKFEGYLVEASKQTDKELRTAQYNAMKNYYD